MDAGLLRARNDRRKVNRIQIRVTQYFGGLRIEPVIGAVARGRGHSPGFADIAIAATAHWHDLTILAQQAPFRTDRRSRRRPVPETSRRHVAAPAAEMISASPRSRFRLFCLCLVCVTMLTQYDGLNVSIADSGACRLYHRMIH